MGRLSVIRSEACVDELENEYRNIISDIDHMPRKAFLGYFESFKEELNLGNIRAAEKKCGVWQVNSWVKQFILFGFKYGALQEVDLDNGCKFFEKETLGQRKLKFSDRIRVVSNNVTIRDGSYIAPGAICMPPCFINIGSFIDENALIDSNSLVGSCAQIGKNVHIGAGAQIGGVLDPIGDIPVIIEDNVFIGGNCGIFDGAIIKKGAIIGAGTVITGSVAVYDLVKGEIYSRTASSPLVIPENALVVPGTKMIESEAFGNAKLSIQTPIIVKYVDGNNPWIKAEAFLRNISGDMNCV